MFQNEHDELATTKSELENNKREMTDMKEKNLRLTNEDSRLRRKIEDRDRLIASSQAELEELRISLAKKQLDKVHDKLAVATRELESKKN
jgi:chromosome segregation ATPase